MMRYVREQEYMTALRSLRARLDPATFDAVMGLKRSGLFPAVFLSHQLGIPMFADTEVGQVPEKLRRILLVDTVARTGRSMEKTKRRLLRAGKSVTTAVLYKENASSYPVDHFLETAPDLVHFFYERLRWEPSPLPVATEEPRG